MSYVRTFPSLITVATARSRACALAALAQPVEHHADRENGGNGIDFVLARVLGRRAVAWLEDRQPVADIARAAKPKSTHHLRRQVRDDVAEHIGGHQHIVVHRILQQPHADGVHVGVIHLYLGEVLVHLAGDLEEHALGGAHHVGLVDHGHLAALVLPANSNAARMIRSEPARLTILAESARSFCGTSLKAANGLESPASSLAQFRRNRVELHAGVQIFRVLAEDHQVDARPCS